MGQESRLRPPVVEPAAVRSATFRAVHEQAGNGQCRCSDEQSDATKDVKNEQERTFYATPVVIRLQPTESRWGSSSGTSAPPAGACGCSMSWAPACLVPATSHDAPVPPHAP